MPARRSYQSWLPLWPQQLGRFPLWQGTREFVPAMQDIYRAASQRAVELLLAAEPPVKAAAESDSAMETGPGTRHHRGSGPLAKLKLRWNVHLWGDKD